MENMENTPEPQKPFIKKDTRLHTERPEPDPELQKLINSIDLDFLHSIILEDLKHTDLYPSELNFVNSEKIIGVKELWLLDEEITGVYLPRPNLINISKQMILRHARLANVSDLTALTYFICHEIAHSLVKNIVTRNSEGILISRKYGYGRISKSISGSNQKVEFDIFEEGLTEKYGKEIFLKFSKNKSDFLTEDETKRFIQFRQQDRGRAAKYNSAVWFIETLIKRISNETDFSEEMVWHAILRDKLESRGFDDRILQDLIVEFAGDEDFLDELKKAELPQEFEKLQDKLNRAKSPDFISHIHDLLERYPINPS